MTKVQIEYTVVIIKTDLCPEIYEKIKPTFDIAKGAYSTEMALLTGENELYYHIDKEDAPGTMYCLAVDKNNTVIGFILLESDARTKTLWTSHVYVRPEVRQKGVYKLMMERVKKFARDCRFNRVFSVVHRKNWPSQQAHKRAGFKKCWVGYEIPMENEHENI